MFNKDNKTTEIDEAASTQKTLSANKGKMDYDVTKRNPDLTRRKPSSYLNTNDLDVPEEIKQAFAKSGYHLRWVRFIVPGTSNDIDYRNLGRRVNQGYTFVSIKEAPEMALTSFKQDINIVGFDQGDFKDVIVKGDLALMKVPLENVAERNAEVAGQVRSQMQAVETQASRNRLIGGAKTTSQVYRPGSKSVGFQED